MAFQQLPPTTPHYVTLPTVMEIRPNIFKIIDDDGSSLEVLDSWLQSYGYTSARCDPTADSRLWNYYWGHDTIIALCRDERGKYVTVNYTNRWQQFRKQRTRPLDPRDLLQLLEVGQGGAA